MTFKSSVSAAAVTFAILWAPGVMAATAGVSELSIGAYIHMQRTGQPTEFDHDYQQVTSPAGYMSNLGAYADARIDTETSHAFTEGSGSATWVNANEGNVRFHTSSTSSIDAAMESVEAQQSYGDAARIISTEWNYRFTTSGAGTFKVTADTHRDFGAPVTELGDWFAEIEEWVGDQYHGYQEIEVTPEFLSGTDEFGSAQFQLEAGKTYEVYLRASPQVITPTDPTVHDLNYSSATNFHWTIDDSGTSGGGGGNGAVPEPASWAMTLGGFGLVGGAMRVSRRRTAVAFK